MPFPRISIVTPSYNHAHFVEWTVRSVILQRYPNLEYIFMDGGSKDKTVEVLEPYRGRFAHFVSEKDGGQADAISRGFARATGDIMAYLNSDDMLAPGALEFVASYFEKNPDVDVIYSHRITVDADNKVIWYWILPEHSNYLMLRWDLIPQETCFWRRSAFDKWGNVDPSFQFAMDYDLFARYMAHGAKFRRVNRFLGCFRQHAGAKTSQLLDSTGKTEIQRVWQTNKLRNHWGDTWRMTRFYKGTLRRGSTYTSTRMPLPGSLSGVGYDYDQIWGGMLNAKRLPCREGDQSTRITA